MNTSNQLLKKSALFLLNIKIHTTWRLQFIWMVLKNKYKGKIISAGQRKEQYPLEQTCINQGDEAHSRLNPYYE